MEPIAATDMVDRVVAERYRIDSVIGVGSLSAVFAARDRITDSQVALKLFDHALGEDERFVDRLLAAVEGIASLEHPNLVPITDWGSDDGGPFIVMELCAGGSLADFLAAGRTLDPSQALVMALQAGRGLNACHIAGVFHRDVRPGNVLFTHDQQVRLCDVGLREVLTSAPIPQAAHALDNVRYASPEQARGRDVDGTTDLYSLALVLSEAVSGEPPHVEETVVGTLMDRAESPARLHAELGSLLGPLERCGRVDPVERPAAEELAISLLATAETLPRPTAIELVGIRSDDEWRSDLRFVNGVVPEPVEANGDQATGLDSDAVESDPGALAELSADVAPAAEGTDQDVSGDAPASRDLLDTPIEGLVLADDEQFAADVTTDVEVSVPGVDVAGETATGPPDVSAEPTLDDGGAHEDEFGAPALTLVPEATEAAVAGDDLGDSDDGDAFDGFDVSALGPLDDLDDFGDESMPPDDGRLDGSVRSERPVSLEDLERAEPVFADAPDDGEASTLDVPQSATVRRSGLAYEELEDDAEDRLPWWPLVALALLVAGAAAASVWFLVLDGAGETAEVPDLVGEQFEDIDARIDGREWELRRLDARADGSAAGEILAQSPLAGADLDAGETLTVTVSLGNAMVEIPSDLNGLSVEQAASRLGSVGLALGSLTEVQSESLEAGLVVGLNEPTTQMPTGEAVDLRVSSGPQDRIVPNDLVGTAIGEATTVLVGQRLQPVEERVFDPEAPVGTVLGIEPAPGTVLPADSTVTLLVSDGPEPVIMPDIVGLTLEEAVDEITELGLIWIDEEGTPGEDVIGSLPPIGAEVEVGTEVTIILAEGDE